MTTTLYREKHVVARERAAWSAGVEWTLYHFGSAMLDASLAAARREHPEAAKKAYPFPTITRPRVARDPHSPQCDWKVVCSCLTVRIGALPANATFQNYPRPGEAIHPTLERCKLWADLLANPNETVEDL